MLLHSPVDVRPDRKPQSPLFSLRNSIIIISLYVYPARKEKELKAEAAREEKARKQQEKARQAEMKAIAVRRRKMALEMVAEEAKKDG